MHFAPSISTVRIFCKAQIENETQIKLMRLNARKSKAIDRITINVASIPPVLAALEGGSDKKTICQYGLKSIVYFDTCYLGIIFPKYLDSNFLQIFFMLLCVTGAKNGYKCVKYFIFHFFSHISWKIGLPLCLIVFMF